MYKGLIRPVLFLIDPEKVHKLVVFLVRLITSVPKVKRIIRNYLGFSTPALKINFAGIEFSNRVGLAAGFDKNAEFFNAFDVFGFSFIEIGTVTPKAQPGNPKPRLFRLPKDKALINRMGFNNKGVDYVVKNLRNRDHKIIIGGNIGKNTLTPNDKAADDYEKCFRSLYNFVDYLAVNISCPNVKDMAALQNPKSLRIILNRLMKARAEQSVYKPVFIKISPDLTFHQIDETLEVYKEAGLDGIIATNTTTDRNCLNSPEKTVNKLCSGGISGAPIKNRTLEVIRYICKQSENKIPLIGVGGVLTADDALDMIKAGASLVQVYTGFIYEGPFIIRKINTALAVFLSDKENKIEID